jgi:glutamate carboxypeptidase
MVWSTDEESASDSSRTLTEEEARKSEAVLVLRASDGQWAVKTARKGIADYELTAHTECPAHAGVDPRKGVNAIRELAVQILALTGCAISIAASPSTSASSTRLADQRRARAGNGQRRRPRRHPGRLRVHRRRDAWTHRADARGAARGERRVQPAADGTFSRRGAVVRDRPRLRREIGLDLLEGATGGGSDAISPPRSGFPPWTGSGRRHGAHAFTNTVMIAELPERAAISGASVQD